MKCNTKTAPIRINNFAIKSCNAICNAYFSTKLHYIYYMRKFKKKLFQPISKNSNTPKTYMSYIYVSHDTTSAMFCTSKMYAVYTSPRPRHVKHDTTVIVRYFDLQETYL